MDIQTVLRQHAEGFYDKAFNDYRNSSWVMTGYIAHDTDPEREINPKCVVQGACHAAVNRVINRNTALAVITMADNKLVDNPGAIEFYNWLINKSFFSDVFLCKDPVLSLRYGFVKRIDVAAAKWLGASQLARLSTSEFKQFMHAVYDILASGFDIHPMLLLIIATELNLISDKQLVKATKTSRLLTIYEDFHSSNSGHLPFVYARSNATLKDICKDDPTKEFGWIKQDSFKDSPWPINSNYILSSSTKVYDGKNSPEIREALKAITIGTGSMLFNLAKKTEKLEYTSIWQDAIDELKAFAFKDNLKAALNGVAINLTPLEMLSKKLKLGE